MKVKAGKWRSLSFMEKADKLINASVNNRSGYLLRKRKEKMTSSA